MFSVAAKEFSRNFARYFSRAQVKRHQDKIQHIKKDPMTSSKQASYDAFQKVDESVSKPVLGSDGAKSWQAFQRETKSSHRSSVAPKAPLKKADKLGTGFSSWEEERAHEEKIRKDAGHSSTNSGYTTFKNKNSAEEAAERKRIKQINERIRPDDQDYFIPSKEFKGWKFNYIFTTRPDRGTGYFWDGMDAIKELRGELQREKPVTKIKSNSTSQEEVSKPKRKKRKKNEAPVMVNDPNNPLEQVAAIIQKRNQSLTASLPGGWEMARDPSSGKQYYYNRATGERSWNKPEEKDKGLPEGWKAALDKSTGKTYYYNKAGETKWEKPS